MIQELKLWATALGGDVNGHGVICPGPGHSSHDRSLSVTPYSAAPDGFLVHSFAGDDPIACKDYVRAKLGFPEFKPNGHAKPERKIYFDYRNENGALVYQVEREDLPSGKKIRQRRPDGNGGWVWNLKGVDPIPYRLSELLEALANDRTIVIAEGEAKVDLLWSWGIPATCNSGGAGKWRTEHSSYLAGANVVILPDNDEAGRLHLGVVAASLEEVGASIRVLDLPGLPEKGDVIDWAAAGGTREKLDALIEMATPWAATPEDSGEKPPGLPILNLASLAGKPVPVRLWHVPDIIPANQVTLISGNGGDGKSLLALQLGVATATATDWIGRVPELGGVLYASAEDDPDEIHRRVADIVSGRDKMSFAALGDFNLADLSSIDAVFAAPIGRQGVLATTELFQQIKAKVAELRPALLIVDALADVYGGDENVRVQVRQFIALLRRLAVFNRVTVVLIAHPSLSGMASGTGMSGSTGWNNSVRSRLYLEPAIDEAGEPDPCLRKLTVMKANYGPKGTSIALKWELGRFVLVGGDGSFERMATEARDDSLFLELLKSTKDQGRNVSPWGGQTNAPKVFASMPEANGTTLIRFKASMERLLRDGKIVAIDEGPPSRRYTRLVEK